MTVEYGIFGEESADYTEEHAYESGFYSQEEAETALKERYNSEDGLHVHVVEGVDEEEEEEDDDEDDEDDEEEFFDDEDEDDYDPEDDD